MKKIKTKDNTIYRIQLNMPNAKRFDEVLRDYNRFLIKKQQVDRNGNKYYIWNRVCAVNVRLYDTVDYINKLKLGCCISDRSAFDFYDFINNAATIVECIELLVKDLGVDKAIINDIKNAKDCFTRFGTDIDGNEQINDMDKSKINDGSFFRYVQSLTSVHPTMTNKDQTYLGDSLFHCCPFVLWSDSLVGRLINKDGRDLTVTIYKTVDMENDDHISLYLVDFERYINKWLGVLPKLEKEIEKENDKIVK